MPSGDARSRLLVENGNSRSLPWDGKKYTARGTGKIREQFVDLTIDPGEMKSPAADPTCPAQVEEGRKSLRAWYAANGLELDDRYSVQESIV